MHSEEVLLPDVLAVIQAPDNTSLVHVVRANKRIGQVSKINLSSLTQQRLDQGGWLSSHVRF
jgi:hypothetical protein